MPLNEFDIITAYFNKASRRKDVKLGIGDDCAVLTPPAGKNLLISTDTLNVGSHFFPDTHPFDIGYKAAAVSLSDLAAMGGTPAWLLLALTLPEVDSLWLENFSQGLFSCLHPFDIDLVGGNLSRGPLAVTTQIIGYANEFILTRSGAKPNDQIFVTGSLGDAGLALKILKKEMPSNLYNTPEIEKLTARLWRPPARIHEGELIAGIANAAIDISDGLIADLQHILDQSKVGATLYLEKLPMGILLQRLPVQQSLHLVLNAGDDYELCFTVPEENLSKLQTKLREAHCELICIGRIEKTEGLRLQKSDGSLLVYENQGYKHF